ncbi:MAG TPA: hypothetical protein VM802_14660 [Chitinophaga sp.]|uniref:hypothetical protein n=1 Tax=Chitinophaga sp. TaxID=1869181 RepID=UPI002B941E83|nr:hypothetical protein [Chitinophaga sp.]HVI46114.1 hypothetical protein [Chitinophaga sp.]
MKKLLLSAAVALAAVSGYAQTSTSPTNAAALPSDRSNVAVSMCLSNIIELNPPRDQMGAIFNKSSDYNNGEELKDPTGNPSSDFTVSSNRNFNITINAAAPNFSYTGSGTGNNVMPCTVLSYNLASNNTGGTDGTSSPWTPLTIAPAPLINNGTYGAAKTFAVKLKAEPGWNFTGGSYAVGVILTATQL